MELNNTVVKEINNEIDTLIMPNRSGSIGLVTSTIEKIENYINDDNRFKTLSREDFLAMSNQLKTARSHIELMTNLKVIDEKNQEKQWADDANTKLADMIKKENFTEITLQQLFENFILVWTKIFLEVTDPATYTYTFDQNQWWLYLVNLIYSLFFIFTKEDRLIYVGIGLVIASFFIYYILISA
jgi:hypothetical protein